MDEKQPHSGSSMLYDVSGISRLLSIGRERTGWGQSLPSLRAVVVLCFAGDQRAQCSALPAGGAVLRHAPASGLPADRQRRGRCSPVPPCCPRLTWDSRKEDPRELDSNGATLSSKRMQRSKSPCPHRQRFLKV